MNEFDLRKFLYSKSLLTEEITKEEIQEETTETTITEEVTEEVVEETEVTTEEEVTESPNLTKESLKSLIREKITSILNEAEEDEAEEDEAEEDEAEEAPVGDMDLTEPTDVELGDGEENEVIKLFSQAKQEISGLGADEETKQKMMRQINNTITMFARDYLANEN
jgi:hypothetical protein